jgi:hypothetical protein
MTIYEQYMEQLIKELETETDPVRRNALKNLTWAYRYGMDGGRFKQELSRGKGCQ